MAHSRIIIPMGIVVVAMCVTVVPSRMVGLIMVVVAVMILVPVPMIVVAVAAMIVVAVAATTVVPGAVIVRAVRVPVPIRMKHRILLPRAPFG